MLTQASLRNLYKKEYYNYFKSHDVENLNKRVKTNNGKDYSKYQVLIKRELKDPTGTNSASSFDGFLFNKIFFEKSNYQFVYQLENHFIKEENFSRTVDIEEYLSKFPGLNFNKQIPFETTNDFEVCTTRIIYQKGKAHQVQLLIKCDKVNTKRGEITLFASITLDIERNLLLIKLNHNLFESHKSKPTLIHHIKLTLVSDVLRPLKIQYSSITETKTRKLIFTLFKELSEEAEKIINSQVKSDTETKITNFLKGINVEVKKDYVKQIKAVIYQDISESFVPTSFPQGWVFKFFFREGDFTRASSRTDDYSPIYSSKVYWNLKEIVFKERKMQEVGIHWILPITNGSIFVKIESKNDTLIIQYYDKPANSIDRKEKEDFVIQKIRGNLPKK